MSQETKISGFGGTPDVIAHSFGTWLLGHALKENEDLRVGRVVLTGCILRPDFDWAPLLERKQVQAVLCHVAARDGWAKIAHYIIPDSGPSGRRGFDDRMRVSHEIFKGKGHSDFFKEDMPALLEKIWRPFLTEAQPSRHIAEELPSEKWKPAWWPFRATIFRISLLATVGGVLLISMAALILGFISLWRLIEG